MLKYPYTNFQGVNGMRPTLLIDLDDTLLDFHKGEYNAVKKSLAQMGLPSTDELARRYSEINDAQWKRLEKGEITRQEVLVGRFRLLFDEMGVDASADQMKAVYEGLISQEGHLFDGAQELLEALQADYDLCIISNGTAVVQDARITKTGLAPYFKHIFISQRVGVNKPSPIFFERCLEAMPEVRREDCLIIGDSLSSDILGGMLSGIKTCWLNRTGNTAKGDVKPDYEVTSLDEILPLVRKIFGN